MAFECRERLNEAIERSKTNRENERAKQLLNKTVDSPNKYEMNDSEWDKKKPVVGYTGFLPQCVSSNIFGQSFADEKKNGFQKFLRKQKEKINPVNNKSVDYVDNDFRMSLDSSRFPTINSTEKKHRRSKSYQPVMGYTGHINQFKNSNIIGMTYIKAKEQAKYETEKNSLLKDRIVTEENKLLKPFSLKNETYPIKRRLSFSNGKPVLTQGRLRPDWK